MPDGQVAPPISEEQRELFRRCRSALGLSLNELAAALKTGDRTVRRWYDGEKPILGTAWVALRFMLRDQGCVDLVQAIERAVELEPMAEVTRPAISLTECAICHRDVTVVAACAHPLCPNEFDLE